MPHVTNDALKQQKEPMKKRILLVDDHEMFRKGLKAFLDHQKDMEVVGEAENGQEAISRSRELLPDVVLMNFRMPVMDGVEATRKILAEIPGMKILALSFCSDECSTSAMLRAGAVGYLIKGDDSEELTVAIRKAADCRICQYSQ